MITNVQTVAGIISLLNDYRLSQGKPPLGFLNLWLYGRGSEGLNDITSGSNPGCNTEGFTAIKGWDPVRPTKLVSLHQLIFNSIGHGSRDTQLRKAAAINAKYFTQQPSNSPNRALKSLIHLFLVLFFSDKRFIR